MTRTRIPPQKHTSFQDANVLYPYLVHRAHVIHWKFLYDEIVMISSYTVLSYSYHDFFQNDALNGEKNYPVPTKRNKRNHKPRLNSWDPPRSTWKISSLKLEIRCFMVFQFSCRFLEAFPKETVATLSSQPFQPWGHQILWLHWKSHFRENKMSRIWRKKQWPQNVGTPSAMSKLSPSRHTQLLGVFPPPVAPTLRAAVPRYQHLSQGKRGKRESRKPQIPSALGGSLMKLHGLWPFAVCEEKISVELLEAGLQ